MLATDPWEGLIDSSTNCELTDNEIYAQDTPTPPIQGCLRFEKGNSWRAQSLQDTDSVMEG